MGGIKIGSGLNLFKNRIKPRDSGNGYFSERNDREGSLGVGRPL